MKAAATLSASNATKRAGKGGSGSRGPVVDKGKGRPLWRGTQVRVEEWRRLGCSEFLCRAVQFGISDPPSVPFRCQGEVLGVIPQSVEDKEFAAADFEEGFRSGIYHEIAPEHARKAVAKGAIVSSAFTVLQDTGEDMKGRFVVNLAK